MRGLLLAAVLAGASPVAAQDGQAACSAKDYARKEFAVREAKDDFDGHTRVRSAPAELGAGRGVNLTFQRFTDKQGAESYQIFVAYLNPEWLFIRRGESLRFKIGDEEPLSLTVEGDPKREVLSGRSVYESAMYETDIETIAKLANSPFGAVVRLYGDKGYLEREFTPKVVCALRRFVAAVDSTRLTP